MDAAEGAEVQPGFVAVESGSAESGHFSGILSFFCCFIGSALVHTFVSGACTGGQTSSFQIFKRN